MILLMLCSCFTQQQKRVFCVLNKSISKRVDCYPTSGPLFIRMFCCFSGLVWPVTMGETFLYFLSVSSCMEYYSNTIGKDSLLIYFPVLSPTTWIASCSLYTDILSATHRLLAGIFSSFFLLILFALSTRKNIGLSGLAFAFHQASNYSLVRDSYHQEYLI